MFKHVSVELTTRPPTLSEMYSFVGGLISRHVEQYHNDESPDDDKKLTEKNHPCFNCTYKTPCSGGGEFDQGRLGSDCKLRVMCFAWKAWRLERYTLDLRGNFFCPKCGQKAHFNYDKVRKLVCPRCHWIES